MSGKFQSTVSAIGTITATVTSAEKITSTIKPAQQVVTATVNARGLQGVDGDSAVGNLDLGEFN